MKAAEKTYFSIRELAQMYGLSESFLYKRSAERTIPVLKVGTRVLVSREEFERWLEAHRVKDGEGRR